MDLSEELRTKIRRRVRRHLDGAKVHRIHQTDDGIFYRVHAHGSLVVIRQDKLGRIYIPRSV